MDINFMSDDGGGIYSHWRLHIHDGYPKLLTMQQLFTSENTNIIVRHKPYQQYSKYLLDKRGIKEDLPLI